MVKLRITARLVLTAVTALLLVSAGTSCMAINLLTNPGFESGWTNQTGSTTSNTTGTQYGWTWQFLGSTCQIMKESGSTTKKYHSGGEASRWGFTLNGQVTNQALLRQDVYVAPSSSYTASVWLWPYGSAWPMIASDTIAIKIVEYDINNAVVVDRGTVAELRILPSAYTQISATFTTNPSTVKVRYALFYSSYKGSGFTVARMDDASLDGPAATGTVTGAVTSGGVGVEGATVTVGSLSGTTGPGGVYTISGVPVTGATSTVRASKSTHFAQSKYRVLVPSTNTVDFSLVAVGSNLLANAGFDDNAAQTPYTTAPDLWTSNVSGTFLKESFWLANPPISYYFKSGEEASDLVTTSPPQECILDQTVPVQPSESYTAKAWLRAVGDNWGGNPDQKAALYVQEFDRTGTLLQDHKVYLSDFADWEQLSWPFSTSATGRTVRVACWANMTENYQFTYGRAIFDDMELSGSAGEPLPPLYGVVKSGGTPIEGAYVELVGWGYSTTTAADGYWEFTGVLPTDSDPLTPNPSSYAVRVSKDGYHAQVKARTSPYPTAVAFDLVAVGDNLLYNAGFDDGSTNGWTNLEGAYALVRPENLSLTSKLVAYYADSTEEAICIYNATGTLDTARVVQYVGVQPSTSYAAKVKFHAAWKPGTTSVWGTDLNQTAALCVQEYDAAGNPVGAEQLAYATLADLTQWENIELPFTTAANTVMVSVGGYAAIVDKFSVNGGRAVFDDFELNGPKPPFSLSGTVTSGGSPVVSATVDVSEYIAGNYGKAVGSYGTGPGGTYTVPGAQFGHKYRVCVSKVGCYTQNRNKVVNGLGNLDFNVSAIGSNRLFNIGFDEIPALRGWTIPTIDGSRTGIESGKLIYIPTYFYSADEAAYLDRINVTGGEARSYQRVSVLPSTAYTARAEFMPRSDARYANKWLDPTQKAAVYVQEYDALGAPVGSRQYAYATIGAPDLNAWQTLSLPITTTASTASVEIGPYAYLLDNFNGDLAHAIFDDLEFTGPGGPSMTITDVKKQLDETSATVSGKVVTASFPGYFYIEEQDRSSGIKVEGKANPAELVDVSGNITTTDGERVIDHATVVRRAFGTIPLSLGMSSSAAAGGVSPVGLYVVMWGRVDATGGSPFTLSDGGASLKVYGAATANDYVRVEGALGAEMSGTDVIPVLRAVSVTKVEEEE